MRGITGRRRFVTGALFVAFTDPPQAKYECLLCRTTEGPVSGAEPVQIFVKEARTVHRGRCPAVQSAIPDSPPGHRSVPGPRKDSA